MIDLGDFVTLGRSQLYKNVLRDIERLECSLEFAKLTFELCFEINRLANGKRMRPVLPFGAKAVLQ